MSIDKYLFWSNIQNVVNKLDDLTEYRESKWIENFSFKENLESNIKFIINLLEEKIKLYNSNLFDLNRSRESGTFLEHLG